MTRGYNTSTVKGMNIYYDDKNRSIYYDRFTKQGYLIQDKNSREYYMYQNRYMFVAIAVILASGFISDFWICLSAGICALVVFEYMFRMKFLKSLSVVGGFVPNRKSGLVQAATTPEEKNKLLLKAGLYLALSILLVVNAMTNNYEMWVIVMSYGLSVGAFCLAILNFVSYRKSVI